MEARNDIVPWAEKEYSDSDDEHSLLSQAAGEDIFENSDQSSNHDMTPVNMSARKLDSSKKNSLKNKSLKQSKQSLQSLWKSKQGSKVHSEQDAAENLLSEEEELLVIESPAYGSQNSDHSKAPQIVVEDMSNQKL